MSDYCPSSKNAQPFCTEKLIPNGLATLCRIGELSKAQW